MAVMDSCEPVVPVTVRPGRAADIAGLRRALYRAVCWRPTELHRAPEVVLNAGDVRLYIDDWGRPGDTAMVAVDERGTVIGAAWFRFFPEEPRGYGFVGVDVPEVTVGVSEQWQGRGVGRRLLGDLHAAAWKQGITRLSRTICGAAEGSEW